MAILAPADTALAAWTYLYNAIKAETQTGGRLVGLVDVRKSLDFFGRFDPPVYRAGVELTDWVTQDLSSGRRKLIIEYTIRVSAQSVANGTTVIAPNGDDALAKLWAFISDGNGNGFSEVLRDPKYRFLGGNVDIFNLLRIKPFTMIDDGETGDVWAEAYLTCRAEKTLAIM